MTDLQDSTPSTVDAPPPAGAIAWLVAGIGAGALLAAAVVLGGIELLESDEVVSLPPPRFLDESSAAGIDHRYDGEFEFFVGGGVAVFDCNDDRRPDVYLAGGVNSSGLYVNQSAIGGSLEFAPMAASSTDLTAVTGAYPIDVDGDGLVDLAVLRIGENVMLRGLGGCAFERANEDWGVDGGNEWTAAFSATWESSATLPTLAFGNYLANQGQAPVTCEDSYIVRPGADGSHYGERTALSPGWCTLSILFSDWDRSGGRDLRMTNDRHYYRDGEEQLWRIEAGEEPTLYTAEDGWQSMKIWGMGIASQDLDGDHLPEVFLTSQGDNKLQTLADGPDQPTYEDIALENGATVHRPFTGPDTVLPSTAWHAEFQDVNNDTFMDLFVSKGNVEAQPEFASQDPSNLLIGNSDGSFSEGAGEAGIVTFDPARGAALADFNLDGLLDLIQVNRREPVRTWRNVGSGEGEPAAMGNWLAIQIHQEGPNRDGIGSWIEVETRGRTVEREITIGGGHAGGQLGWAHFGLGEGDSARVRVSWPDGERGPWMTVEANQFLDITRGADEPVSWSPA